MVSCASCGCSQTPKQKDSGVTFHSFPKDEKRRTTWIQFVNKFEFIPKSSSVLCSHHFAADCFDRTSMVNVRLHPNAIPTIEVDRLKYVRTFNPVVTRPIKCAEENLTDPDIMLSILEPSSMPGPSSMPVASPTPGPLSMYSPSAREQTSSPPADIPFVDAEDTSPKLKRKISDLHKTNILKSRKIRKLQNMNWRQKKQISSLKALTLELKNKNLSIEKRENIMIQRFGKNKDIIERLLKKSENKKQDDYLENKKMDNTKIKSVYLNKDEENSNGFPKPVQQIEQDKIVDETSNRICRLCSGLIKVGKVTNIFNTLDLVQKINYALPINVKSGDGLPNLICGECENKLNAFHSFVCDVVKADKQLRTTEKSPDDHVTKTIEEIFGADSDEDLKLSQNQPNKHPLSDSEEPKRLKTEATLPDAKANLKYICRRCGATFQEFSTLLDHYKIQHSGKALPCPEIDCTVTTKNEKLLREHIQDSHGVPVICYKCGKIFMNQDALLKHQRNKHSAKVCSFCWMTFETVAAYDAHMYEHSNSNHQQCTYCHRVYQTSRGLKRHTLQCHSGEITLLMDNVIMSDEV